jgi:hypothetical protein
MDAGASGRAVFDVANLTGRRWDVEVPDFDIEPGRTGEGRAATLSKELLSEECPFGFTNVKFLGWEPGIIRTPSTSSPALKSAAANFGTGGRLCAPL